MHNSIFSFLFWLAVTYIWVCLHLEYKNILPLQLFKESICTCSSSISIRDLHCDIVVPHTSNKVIFIHEIQVNHIRSNKRGYSRTSCIMQCEKKKVTIASTKEENSLDSSSKQYRFGVQFSQFEWVRPTGLYPVQKSMHSVGSVS